ncbi:MAG: GNAT family N-acetyltransferase [Caldilineaceae bacterium]|nr:GNAT family N-acetyltransferase [Caldilineaceae bacterium]
MDGPEQGEMTMAHPTTDHNAIPTDRLWLISMTPPFLEASLAGDRPRAAGILGATVPAVWQEETWLMRLRLEQLQADSVLQPWLLRAIVHRESNMMVGHVGFHGYPGGEYLQEYAPTAAEMGYTIFPDYRHPGYPRAAAAALMHWAATEQGVRQFVFSISPDNIPSQRIAVHFGFRKVGRWEDEEDGPEDVFVLDWAEAGIQ